MNTDFREILIKLNELFPINREGTDFKGTHSLTLNGNNQPQMNIWIRKGDRFRMIHVVADNKGPVPDFDKPDVIAWAEIEQAVKELFINMKCYEQINTVN